MFRIKNKTDTGHRLGHLLLDSDIVGGFCAVNNSTHINNVTETRTFQHTQIPHQGCSQGECGVDVIFLYYYPGVETIDPFAVKLSLLVHCHKKNGLGSLSRSQQSF